MNQLANSSGSANGHTSNVMGQPLSAGRGKKNGTDFLYSLPNSAQGPGLGQGPVAQGQGLGQRPVSVGRRGNTMMKPDPLSSVHMQNGMEHHHRNQNRDRNQELNTNNNNKGIKRKRLLQNTRLVDDDEDDDDAINDDNDDDDEDDVDDDGGNEDDHDDDNHDDDTHDDGDNQSDDNKINPKLGLKTFSSFNDPRHRFHGHAERSKCNHDNNDAKRAKYR